MPSLLGVRENRKISAGNLLSCANRLENLHLGKNEPVVPVPDLDKIIHQSRPIFYKRWFLWFHKEASPTDWIVAVATVFIALSTLAQVCVTVYQWREMHAAGFQADKMIDSANKTEAAAEKSAHASRDFADTAALINQGIQNAVDKLNTQASATTRLATNSENANKYVMQADRPWLVEFFQWQTLKSARNQRSV
jgi:hypothetical protein